MNRIIYNQEDGTIAIVIPSTSFEGTMDELALEVVPNGIEYEVVADTDIPTDRTFRNAWERDVSAAPEKVKTNMVKAKEIAHDVRRKTRDEAFKPLDVQATIPAQASAAETARQSIRDADALKQIAIDDATTEAELKTAMNTPVV